MRTDDPLQDGWVCSWASAPQLPAVTVRRSAPGTGLAVTDVDFDDPQELLRCRNGTDVYGRGVTDAQALTVWRLEMPQVPGYRFHWLGPYTSHWLTARAEEIVRYMEAEHTVTHPEPRDRRVFAHHREVGDPLLCGSLGGGGLQAWFGDYAPLLKGEGGHLARYEVPLVAVIDQDDRQVIFVQSRARLIGREGTPPPAELVRSSAGSRAAAMLASNGIYEYDPASRKAPSAAVGADT